MSACWKLTHAQRNEVARRYYAGERGPVLGIEFGITKSSVMWLARARGLGRKPRLNGTSIEQAARKAGLKPETVVSRLYRGWSAEQALSTEIRGALAGQ